MQIKFHNTDMCLKKISRVGQNFFHKTLLQHREICYENFKILSYSLEHNSTYIDQTGIKSDGITYKLRWFPLEAFLILLILKLCYLKSDVCMYLSSLWRAGDRGSEFHLSRNII